MYISATEKFLWANPGVLMVGILWSLCFGWISEALVEIPSADFCISFSYESFEQTRDHAGLAFACTQGRFD